MSSRNIPSDKVSRYLSVCLFNSTIKSFFISTPGSTVTIVLRDFCVYTYTERHVYRTLSAYICSPPCLRASPLYSIHKKKTNHYHKTLHVPRNSFTIFPVSMNMRLVQSVRCERFTPAKFRDPLFVLRGFQYRPLENFPHSLPRGASG